MNAQERVLNTLTGKTADGTPWIELYVHPQVISRVIGEPVDKRFGSGGFWFKDADGGTTEYEREAEKMASFAERIHLDAIGCKYWSPVLVASGGHTWSGGGLISAQAIDEAIRTRVPDIDAEGYYACGEKLIQIAHKHGLAGFCTAHFPVERVLGDLGFEGFCYALYDDPELIRYLCDFYTDFAIRNIRNIMKLNPDFLWVADDIAFGQGPFVSKDMWEDIFLPYYRKIVQEITCPWVFHSDGNVLPVLDSLLPLGMNAIHPIEPYSMDIREVRQKYRDRVVLVGNVDMKLLQSGIPGEIRRVVTELHHDLSPGNGWILSSSNSINEHCTVENVRAMGETLHGLRSMTAGCDTEAVKRI